MHGMKLSLTFMEKAISFHKYTIKQKNFCILCFILPKCKKTFILVGFDTNVTKIEKVHSSFCMSSRTVYFSIDWEISYKMAFIRIFADSA